MTFITLPPSHFDCNISPPPLLFVFPPDTQTLQSAMEEEDDEFILLDARFF
jgi:hypothetical protein